MRRLRVRLAVVLISCVAAAGGTRLCASQTPASAQTVPSGLIGRVPFFEQTQRWFELVRAHRIGEWDGAAVEASQIRLGNLELIRSDLRLIYLLLDGAARKANATAEVPGKTLHLRHLAPLLGLSPKELDLPLDLRHLSNPDEPARRVISQIMTRAAMLHTEIAMRGDIEASAIDEPQSLPVTSRQPSAVLIRDGRQIRVPNRAIHWAIARDAFDIVGPPRGGSATAKLWYLASSTYQQQERDYSALLPHLAHARDIFADDPVVFLFSGAAYENLTAPRVQAASEDAEQAIRVLGSLEDLLKEADRYYRRSLELDPQSAMARLRRGRVLDQLNRHEEATVLLRAAEAALPGDGPRCLANLFLGSAEESLGHDAEARAAYERAVKQRPDAQSPKLALAALVWRLKDRAQAVAALRPLATIDPFDLQADPFFTYDIVHIGDANELLERVRRSALEVVK